MLTQCLRQQGCTPFAEQHCKQVSSSRHIPSTENCWKRASPAWMSTLCPRSGSVICVPLYTMLHSPWLSVRPRLPYISLRATEKG